MININWLAVYRDTLLSPAHGVINDRLKASPSL